LYPQGGLLMPEHYTKSLAAELRKALTENGKAVSADLALPDDPQDGRNESYAAFVAAVREQSQRDPAYLQTMLERLAPVALTLPSGQKLRSETGLKNFHALVKEARPDVYVAAVLSDPPPGIDPAYVATGLGAGQAPAPPPVAAPPVGPIPY
jgi:hypothetical protein